MITLFTVPKSGPASTEIGAVQSWRAAMPNAEILIFTAHPEWGSLSSSLNLRILPIESTTSWNTPFLDAIFRKVRQESQHPLCCYINCDIILFSQIQETVGNLAACTLPFLATGRRIDLDVKETIDFASPKWESEFSAISAERGVVHSAAGMDYFIFPKKAMPSLPKFAVGRPAWDNWLIRDTLRRRTALVDTSQAITAIHQNHDYEHVPQGTGSYEGPEADHNRAIAGPEVVFFDITMATHDLLPTGLRRRPLPVFFLARLAARIDARGFLSHKCLMLTANALKAFDRYLTSGFRRSKGKRLQGKAFIQPR